ncbi:gluconate transporter [Thermosinus carboxydivorans Nor1]|uniref:Gluconate transporter n=1 Tax=Thermosinus carboxydivorans Nor1 TaxID=401526 RepID=A1HM40_9FIRM|nr:gluconate:H+ symporter [Thermosinus carboxydivorans]EAX48891.1 gluconate transporter [Thermosinus carboxydivorans Nor1]
MGTTAALMLVLFAAIGLIIFLIMKVRLHAFVTLIVACMFVGFATGMPLAKIGASIEAGMGSTLGFLATILGLGTILGKMLEVSRGAERLARTLINVLGKQRAGWAMMIVGFIAGIPVFFQVGFVLLIPLVFSVAVETGLSMVAIGIPMAVSLITVHCILPPHPAAMAIAGSLKADVGRIIMYGIIVGFPAAIIAGPLWANLVGNKFEFKLPDHLQKRERVSDNEMPSFGITLFTVLLPLLIMVSKTIIELNAPKNAPYMSAVNFIGNPVTALLISALFAYYTLGLARGFSMKQILSFTDQCFGPVAGILLVIGGGGAFNKVLIDSGLGNELAKVLTGLSMNPIILAWLVAVVMRFSVGSATVAMMTAVGIVMPVLKAYPGLDPALIAVAIGAGAISFSHVNDSGFWIVKEFFGLSVTDTLKAYTSATCIAAVVALVATLALANIV